MNGYITLLVIEYFFRISYLSQFSSSPRFVQSGRRGRESSCPPSPRTDPGVRFSRTGLFRQLHFRKRFTVSSWLFPTVRFALVIQPYVSGQGFLYGLQLSVSPFPM